MLRPGTSDESIWDEVVAKNCYKLADRLTGVRILDVGGHIGSFAVASMARGAEVVSFEPDGESFRHLVSNTAMARQLFRSTSVVVNVALSDTSESVSEYTMAGSKTHPAAYALTSRGTGDAVSCWTFRRVLELSRFNLVKLDCEGMEHAIAAQLEHVSDKPGFVVAEVHDLRWKRFECPGCLEWMTNECSINDFVRTMGYAGYSVVHKDLPHRHDFGGSIGTIDAYQVMWFAQALFEAEVEKVFKF